MSLVIPFVNKIVSVNYLKGRWASSVCEGLYASACSSSYLNGFSEKADTLQIVC